MFHSTLIVLSVWLIRVTTMSVRGVNCLSVKNSQSSWLVMHSERGMKCYSDGHISGALLAWLLMVAYCVMFPVATFLLLRRTIPNATSVEAGKVTACPYYLTADCDGHTQTPTN
jgi:hypothetical protein